MKSIFDMKYDDVKEVRLVDVVPNPLNKKSKTWKTPVQLWKRFIEYVKWCSENPLYTCEARTVSNGQGMGSDVELVGIPKVRMVTIKSFCLFAGISYMNFMNYRNGTHGKGLYKEVCQMIVEQIDEIRSGDAAADRLNHNFVAKLMGLSEKIENVNYNFNSVDMTAEQILEISKKLDSIL